MNDDDRISEELLESDGDLAVYKGRPFSGIGFDNFTGKEFPEYETMYKDGLPHGLKRKWYDSGKLEYEISCSNGLKHGEENHWFIDGSLKSKALYEYGIKLKSKSWNEKGLLVDQFELSENSANFRILQDRRKKEGSLENLSQNDQES